MKLILVCLLILSTQPHLIAPATITPSHLIFFQEIKNEGRYEECLLILEQITIDVAQISLLLVAGEYRSAIPLIIRTVNEIMADVQCFKNNIAEVHFDLVLEALTDPNECVMKHMKNAVISIKIALQDVQLGLYKEALSEVVTALKELGLAKQCPK